MLLVVGALIFHFVRFYVSLNLYGRAIKCVRWLLFESNVTRSPQTHLSFAIVLCSMENIGFSWIPLTLCYCTNEINFQCAPEQSEWNTKNCLIAAAAARRIGGMPINLCCLIFVLIYIFYFSYFKRRQMHKNKCFQTYRKYYQFIYIYFHWIAVLALTTNRTNNNTNESNDFVAIKLIKLTLNSIFEGIEAVRDHEKPEIDSINWYKIHNDMLCVNGSVRQRDYLTNWLLCNLF